MTHTFYTDELVCKTITLFLYDVCRMFSARYTSVRALIVIMFLLISHPFLGLPEKINFTLKIKI